MSSGTSDGEQAPLGDLLQSVKVNRWVQLGHTLLGTKYVMEGDVFATYLSNAGFHVVIPEEDERQELQRLIFDELTQGVVLESSRVTFLAIAENCRRRGGEVVGLCCTEFGLLVDESSAPFPVIDSTKAHVRALLART